MLGSISTSLCNTVPTRPSSKHLLHWKSTLPFNFPLMPLHLLWTQLRHSTHKIECRVSLNATTLMPLHLLWTHLRHSTHKIELLATPYLQTPHGCFPESSLWTLLTRHCMIFGLPAFTLNQFLRIHHQNEITSIEQFHRQTSLNSLDKASSMMMNSSGLRTDPWCTLTLTLKTLLSLPFSLLLSSPPHTFLLSPTLSTQLHPVPTQPPP